jgi:hypothetical protein
LKLAHTKLLIDLGFVSQLDHLLDHRKDSEGHPFRCDHCKYLCENELLVRKRGLEPLRPCWRQPLKLLTFPKICVFISENTHFMNTVT